MFDVRDAKRRCDGEPRCTYEVCRCRVWRTSTQYCECGLYDVAWSSSRCLVDGACGCRSTCPRDREGKVRETGTIEIHGKSRGGVRQSGWCIFLQKCQVESVVPNVVNGRPCMVACGWWRIGLTSLPSLDGRRSPGSVGKSFKLWV